MNTAQAKNLIEKGLVGSVYVYRPRSLEQGKTPATCFIYLFGDSFNDCADIDELKPAGDLAKAFIQINNATDAKPYSTINSAVDAIKKMGWEGNIILHV